MELPKQPLSTSQEPQASSNSIRISPKCMKNPKPSKHRRIRHITKRATERRNFNSSLWTLTENTAYTAFLTQNIGLFTMTKIERRDSKINVLMSKAIHTRSADQCRSHHQKMMKYHGDIPNIIAHVAALKQNQGENPQRPIDIVKMDEGSLEPILLDFFEQDELLDKISFCEQLMNGEWDYL